MLIKALVNGEPADTVSILDRGLLYGDGVFRTLRILGGRIQHWQRHALKLQHDCAAIRLQCPETALLLEELHRLAAQQPDAVVKIVITRGPGLRGYAPAEHPASTRILSLSQLPEYPADFYTQGIRLRVCALRLAQQAALAGIKHLNRLENVLAAAEWNDAGIAEGLLLDEEGHVIEGTRCNLFMVRSGGLITPALSRCGVAGVQRQRVIEWASVQGIPCREAQFKLDELLAADEVFLVNSVIGLWPVRELEGRNWSAHPLALQVQEWLSHAID